MLKLTKRQYGILLALLGATLYAVNAPFSKIVLDYLPPILTAGFLYLGSGLGMLAIASFRSRHGTDNVEKKLDRMRKFYLYGLNKAGWNKYSYINVEFDNQIICKKAKNKQ